MSRVLAAYRATGLCNPALYRLTTAGALDRASLPNGLEDWSGSPLYLLTGDGAVRFGPPNA